MLGDKIKALRIENKMYQQDLAHALSVSKSTIAMWETNKRIPDASMLVKIASYFNITVDHLLSDDAIKEKNAPIISDRSDNIDSVPAAEPSLTTQPEYRGFAVLDHDNIYMIPIYRTVSAGYGAFADEYIIGYEPVYLSSQKEAEETFAVVVKGDSMLPRIDEDDIAIVHKQDFFENGDIVVAIQCGNGDGFIKRAFLRKDKLSLESFNPNYPVMTFTGPDIESIKIIGVVKKIIKSI